MSLELKGLCKSFGSISALVDVSLSIKKGELFFLLGPSGCGKTTLLRTIAGLYSPDAGSIRHNGTDITATPVEKRNMGMVFQNYALWPHMSVSRNVAYGLKMRGLDRHAIDTAVQEALAQVDLRALGDRKPGALSGGQQQRVALARALIYKPEVLLLDEPLSNLDAKLRKEMRSEIMRIHEELGITMIYVTHDQEEASAMADRLAMMQDGRILQTGTPRDLYERPLNRTVASFFGNANIINTMVRKTEGSTAEITIDGQPCLCRCRPGISLEEGSETTVMIRPEHLSFAGGPAADNLLSVTVRGVQYNGAFSSYILSVGKQELHMTAPSDSMIAAGRTAKIHVPPEAVYLFGGTEQ